MLGIALHDGEGIVEAKAREQQENEQREQQERTTKVTARVQDLPVNILARMDWKRLGSGAYTLEIGERKHKIMLVPSETTDGYYSVWARLAPDFTNQQWMKEVPLDWAQAHAEMKARLLQADESKLVLVNSRAAWRARPATDKQVRLLRQFDIPFNEDTTCGEASDLIGLALAEREKHKTEKKANRQETSKQKKARESA